MQNEPSGVSLTPDIETASDRYASRFAGEVGEFFLTRQQDLVLSQLLRVVATNSDQQDSEKDGGTTKSSSPWISVLDVGGGHNQLTNALLGAGLRVITHGTAMVCAKRHSRQYNRQQAPFVVSALSSLPFLDQSFDVVVAIRLIAHVDDWLGILAEFCRVARRAVIIDFAPLESLNILTPLLYGIKKRIEKTTRPFVCHWTKDLVAEFEKLGARRVVVDREFFVPMGVHRALRTKQISVLLERIASGMMLTQMFGSPAICTALLGDAGGKIREREKEMAR